MRISTTKKKITETTLVLTGEEVSDIVFFIQSYTDLLEEGEDFTLSVKHPHKNSTMHKLWNELSLLTDTP